MVMTAPVCLEFSRSAQARQFARDDGDHGHGRIRFREPLRVQIGPISFFGRDRVDNLAILPACR